MERGFVKLWRRTLDSGILQHPTAWQVFGYLLLMANSKPHKRIPIYSKSRKVTTYTFMCMLTVN